MKRFILVFVMAIGLVIGASLPVTAIGLSQAKLSCSDGTNVQLTVDADTLTGLTQAVQAMVQYPAGLTCTLATAPLVSFGAIAIASSDDPFVVGGGRYLLPCTTPGPGLPGDDVVGASAPEGFYWVNIAVNAHQKDGAVVGTLNETIPSGQCVGHGHFTSKPTCLVVVDNRATVTSVVTQTSGDTTANFFPGTVTDGNDLRFSFLDNGNPGQQDPGVNDLLNGLIEAPETTCADQLTSPDPVVPLVHGNITVHPTP